MPGSEPLRVYTDGACSGNPGPGGWAWASSVEHHASGGEVVTTNNRMELTAVLRAIESNPGPLVVVMDSTYVKDGLEKWSHGWRRNGWRTKAGDPVKNQDLWEPLLAVRDARGDEVSFEWVKGHSGDPMNDLVDALAVGQRDEWRAVDPGDGSGGGPGAVKLGDLPPVEQRAERRRRDGRIPAGHLLLVVGQRPPELPADQFDLVRDHLQGIIAGHRDLQPDLVVLTGLRAGAERLAAEAALLAGVPYAAVLPFPDPDRAGDAAERVRFAELLAAASVCVTLEKKRPTDKDGFAKAMARRDAWLVHASDQAILVWDELDNRYDRIFADLDIRLGAELTVLPFAAGHS